VLSAGVHVWKLSEGGDRSFGLSSSEDRVFLGRSPLIEHREGGYVVRPRADLERLLGRAYRAEINLDRLIPGFALSPSRSTRKTSVWRRSPRRSCVCPICRTKSRAATWRPRPADPGVLVAVVAGADAERAHRRHRTDRVETIARGMTIDSPAPAGTRPSIRVPECRPIPGGSRRPIDLPIDGGGHRPLARVPSPAATPVTSCQSPEITSFAGTFARRVR
jgi:hypothetical protein